MTKEKKDLMIRYKGENQTDLCFPESEKKDAPNKIIVLKTGVNYIPADLVEMAQKDAQYKAMIERGTLEQIGSNAKTKESVANDSELKEAKEKIESLTSDIEDANDKIAKLEEEVNSGDIEALASELKKAHEKIADLEKESKKALQNKIEKLEQANSSLKEENENLLKEMEEATS